jgi:hypothetical protein
MRPRFRFAPWLPSRASIVAATLAVAASGTWILGGCAGWPDSAPQTRVVLDNAFPTARKDSLVIYDAYWLNVSFAGDPLLPGSSSSPQPAVPTSGNMAYVVLAPGWDPARGAPSAPLLVLQSRAPYSLALGDTLHIAVDDRGFEGNCAADSHLTQAAADFLTQIVFARDFAGRAYDAATCTTTSRRDAGARGEADAP